MGVTSSILRPFFPSLSSSSPSLILHPLQDLLFNVLSTSISISSLTLHHSMVHSSLLFIFLLFPFLSFSIPSPSTTNAPRWLNAFSEYLVDKFNEQSKFELINQEIVSLSPSLRLKSESGAHALQSAYRAISLLLEKRMKAVQRLANIAEESIRDYREPKEPIDDNATSCNFASIINGSDVHFHSEKKEGTKESGVHVNIESYTCEPGVVRDYTWTKDESIDRIFMDNERDDPSIPNQFIGTYTSLTRMYPRRKWEIEPEKITADLFDPKFRPWFVNAEAAPKDIVFLLDYSGSMKGPTMHLSRITLLYILATLNPNDYIAGVWFNKNFASILDCSNTTFIPATTRNKKIFYEKSVKEETEKADLGPPLKFSIEMLRNHSSVLFGDSRSGSHKLIILLTDGIDEWPHTVIQENLTNSAGEKIRVFGMAMGFATGPLPLLDHLACTTNATTSVVDSVADVKAQSRSYLDHLSDVHSLTLQSTTIEDRPISWTNLYMDNQAAGPVITLSIPLIVPIDHPTWFDTDSQRKPNRMGGVAGVDINIKELTAHLPHGDGLRSFIVDNNGMVVYHKDHKLPKTEVHAVRRSACYESSQVKKKSGHALRVQYGHSDERVYRLVGLLDSIPTIDMYELESNSTIVQNLRRVIMDGKCDGKTKIMDKTKTENDYYLCKSFPSTPLTLVIFSSHNVPSYDYTGPPISSSQLTTLNPMVQYLISKRSACNWAIDKIHDDTRSPIGLERLRYSQWINHPDCIDNPSESFSRAMAASLKKWADSWPENPTGSCMDSGILAGIPFDVRYYLNSFVYTRGQVAAFYPMCPESEKSMKQLTEKMEKERLWKKNSSDIQFSVRDTHVIIYKPIVDEKNNRLAIVGIQWRLDFLTDRFINWTLNHTYKEDPCMTHTCLLLSRSAYVIASNMGQYAAKHAPLTEFDSQTFKALRKQREIQLEVSIDYQAECEAQMKTMWASPSNQPSSFIQSLFYTISGLLSTLLSFNFTMLFSAFISPIESQPKIMKNGTCYFQEIVPFERCAYIQYQYTVTKNDHRQFDMHGQGCSRYGRLHNVNNTRLALLVVQQACGKYNPEEPFHYHPRRILGCETIANYPRKRPNYTYTLSSPKEMDLSAERCQRSSSSISKTNSFIIVISTFILRSFCCLL